MQYRSINENEMNRELFSDFVRRQVVTKCWRKEDGEWKIKDVPFIDDWSEEEYATLVSCLNNTILTGGLVYGAFSNGVLKGFVSVEPTLFGGKQKYLDLSSIHVSEDMRGQGIGKELFLAAKEWAREKRSKEIVYFGALSRRESGFL